ncbi:MAG: hypothetical protein ACLTE2_02245 [Eubacteriales bacterium]
MPFVLQAVLAASGSLPVFAVYSILRHEYIKSFHDVAAIQTRKVIFAIDIAGYCGKGRETFHIKGAIRCCVLNTLPNLTVYSPAYYYELRMDLDAANEECDSAVCSSSSGKGYTNRLIFK